MDNYYSKNINEQLSDHWSWTFWCKFLRCTFMCAFINWICNGKSSYGHWMPLNILQTTVI